MFKKRILFVGIPDMAYIGLDGLLMAGVNIVGVLGPKKDHNMYYDFKNFVYSRRLNYVDYDELDAFFEVNKKLADRYGIKCWTNAETFDRDMPIKFLPIKFDKLRMKLEAAKRAGYDKAITFEFSHFMSPQSAYLQAGHLYDRYKEYFGI